MLSALVLASCGRPQRTVLPKRSDTKQTSTSEKKQSADELNSEEFMTQFTQGILDHAETVTLPDGDPDMIRQILAVLK